MPQSINNTCGAQALDPEDPRCARLTLSGRLGRLTNASEETAAARAALFGRHPEMAGWPVAPPHNFEFYKLDISDIWLVDFFGGAANISTSDYFQASPSAPAHYQ